MRDYLLESLGEEKALKTVENTISANESRLKEKQDYADRFVVEMENSALEVDDMLRAQEQLKAVESEVAALQKSVDYWKGVRTALGGEEVLMDKQGNPITADGKLVVEEINSIDDISDDDFNVPTRTVALPQLPVNVSDAIGATGRRVVIKKSIFEKNKNTHPELSSSDSRSIISSALYDPNLIGNNQPIKRPDYKVAIRTGDKNAIVVLDVYQGKDNVEIVGWRKIGAKGLEKMKRQSEREGGQFLILSPNEGSAAALSALPSDVSSASKDNAGLSDVQEKGEEVVNSELDENGRRFVLSSDGTTIFGEIREESGLSAAPIKLSEGYQDENGKGYGLKHIEANHGDVIPI